MAANLKRPEPTSRDDFHIAILCALEEERDTVEALMDADLSEERQSFGKARNDDNMYTYGKLGGKPVVLVTASRMGTTTMKEVASGLHMSFFNILYAFLVGITGGAPFRHEAGTWQESDIHLGDVLVSTHVIEYDFGKVYENDFKRKRSFNDELPPATKGVTNFVRQFQNGRSAAFRRLLNKTSIDLAKHDTLGRDDDYAHPGANTDNVYAPQDRHKHQKLGICAICDQCTAWHHDVCKAAIEADCEELGCEPARRNLARPTKIHFGWYASGNAVMKSGRQRDLLVERDNVIGFEMEGAGAWDKLPTIVVKGVVDYADSHKNKKWRRYPAARAALCVAAMIQEIDLPDRPQVG
ncbi:hypothetical protein LTS10_000935 [Elasticomyces elasticus]|nr:hypothetical protein LTS10_000935 [Elasticomyces elasticus]